jgi:hypothetical protein
MLASLLPAAAAAAGAATPAARTTAASTAERAGVLPRPIHLVLPSELHDRGAHQGDLLTLLDARNDLGEIVVGDAQAKQAGLPRRALLYKNQAAARRRVGILPCAASATASAAAAHPGTTTSHRTAWLHARRSALSACLASPLLRAACAALPTEGPAAAASFPEAAGARDLAVNAEFLVERILLCVDGLTIRGGIAHLCAQIIELLRDGGFRLQRVIHLLAVSVRDFRHLSPAAAATTTTLDATTLHE